MQFGQAKVEDAWVASSGDEYVFRFDITVNDASRVSRIQGIGYRDTNVEHLFDTCWTACSSVPERATFEEFHRNKGTPIVLANVVNGADVGMIQGRGCLSLALKSA